MKVLVRRFLKAGRQGYDANLIKTLVQLEN